VSRFLLLFLFLIWMAWRADGETPAPVRANELALFFGFFLVMVGMLGLWSRLLARRVGRVLLDRAVPYFNRVSLAAKFAVPVWFAVGVFFLGWGNAVQHLLGPIRNWPVQMPGALIGTTPALLAWIGLWWAQFPADHALRERHMLVRLNDGEPIFRPPPLWPYIVANLRLQILFTAVPILLILGAHDAVMLFLWRQFGVSTESAAEGFITFGSALAVFMVVPEILIRVLPTHPLPPSPLRDRMEAMCRAHRLKFRDILIWRTHHRIANALVMGIVPRFRYVLLSDLLLAEMEDEQIEAVFAHELGHVVHRHLIWYLVFMKILVLAVFVMLAALALLAGMAGKYSIELPRWLPPELMTMMLGFGTFVVAFGFVSRRFERQADVFAARTLQRFEDRNLLVNAVNPEDPNTIFVTRWLVKKPPPGEAEPQRSHVGPYGAMLFASALQKVALINNMPIEPTGRWEGGFTRRLAYLMERMADATNNWLHGSIAHRMRTLHRMSVDPLHTYRFDKRMTWLYVALLALLVIGGVLALCNQIPV
jgi:STE24 endopeptidase